MTAHAHPGRATLVPGIAGDLLLIFLQAPFSGAECHQRRLAKLAALEQDGRSS